MSVPSPLGVACSQNMFAVHGDLAHVKVVYDRSTGKSMGYGFVKFTTNEAAAAATLAINGMAIDRKRIKARESDCYTSVFAQFCVASRHTRRQKRFFFAEREDRTLVFLCKTKITPHYSFRVFLPFTVCFITAPSPRLPILVTLSHNVSRL